MKLFNFLNPRKFEVVSDYKNFDIKCPTRSTKYSAGYDFYCMEDITIPPVSDKCVVLVPTGIKADMKKNEVLKLYSRSSLARKLLILTNSVGIIDKDYYNNSNNEGHIYFSFVNLSSQPIELKKGEKIGQGIFEKYKKVRKDTASQIRKGGFGSTNV